MKVALLLTLFGFVGGVMTTLQVKPVIDSTISTVQQVQSIATLGGWFDGKEEK